MIYTDIADIIGEASLTGIDYPKEQIFIYSMPEDVSIGVLITPVPETFFVRDDIPGYYKGEFLTVIRHTKQRDAETLANEVMNALDVHRRTIGTRKIKRMKATTLPHAFPRSQGDYFEFLVQGFVAFSE